MSQKQGFLLVHSCLSDYWCAGWHKLLKPSSRALRIFPIYEDFCGLKGWKWGQTEGVKRLSSVLNPQSSILNPQSSVLSPQKCPKKCFCSQKLDLRHFSRKCRENLNIRILRIKFRNKSGFEDSPQIVPACSRTSTPPKPKPNNYNSRLTN